MRRMFLLVIAATLFVSCLQAQSTSPKNASKAARPHVANEKAVAAVSSLKKLKAKVEIGVTHAEYRSELGDVQYAVNDYLEDAASSSTPLLDSKLRDALRAYTLADSFWKAQLDNDGDGSLNCADAGKALCATYPEAVEPSGGTGWPVIFVPVYRKASWQSASAKVADANALLIEGERGRSPQTQSQPSVASEDEEIRSIARAIILQMKDK